MPNKVAISSLNASTVDILNTIRANASYEYQQYVPEISSENDIIKVGDVLYGYPSLANQFINALVNRIALVKVQSATFNNPYVEFKKGYMENGETIEEIFTNIAKVIHFSYEKAPERQMKRTIPDIRAAFHVINWRVMYPVSIDDNELRRAFLSMSGVQDLIARIVDTVYTANNYDEFLLFKYLIIKKITHGKLYPQPINISDIKNTAEAFRAMSNKLTFMSTAYNEQGVMNTTPRDRQYLFMSADFNAKFDVNVLASAFNMDKADFVGKVKLIDSWTTFDNDRWAEIRAECDGLEEVTATELALMADVQGILVDSEFFQVYDYTNKFTEFYMGAGRYWNYWYHVDKAISASPFANAIVFVSNTADTTLPDNLTLKVSDKSVGDGATVLTLALNSDSATVEGRNMEFMQTYNAISAGIAVHKYGAIMYPSTASSALISFKIGDVVYRSSSAVAKSADVGDTITFTRTDAVANTLSALAITGVTLTPSFASGTTTYTGATSTSSGTISYTATDADAAVTVKLNGVKQTGTTLNFTSGDGNVVTIEVVGVSSGSASTKTYTVTVTYTP